MKGIIIRDYVGHYKNLGQLYGELANYYAYSRQIGLKVETRGVPLRNLERMARLAAHHVLKNGKLKPARYISSVAEIPLKEVETGLKLILSEVPGQVKPYYPPEQYTLPAK